MTTLSPDTKVVVVGLGYVGLPLAVQLAKHFDTLGFDISSRRVEELKRGLDVTREVEEDRLKESVLKYTHKPEEAKGADIYIVTVPTPVDENSKPDLGPVRSSCEMVGPLLKKGAIVVFESTVYPGVTEEICRPELEESSGLVCGQDFFLGYSPERINPGDREHTVDKITKVISGQTPEVVEALAELYGKVTSGGVFRAASIRAAEAAKVIENAQRDINIAFVNEITMIFQKLGISAYDVLEAAGTKWNFLKFSPGLVGGHCIGVDPFYLAERARQINHHPEIILAGRKINDGMGDFIAERVTAQLSGSGRVLVMGLTFKENVPDLRNSKVIDVIRGMERRGFTVDVHDPLADAEEALEHYKVRLKADVPGLNGQPGDQVYDAVIAAVPHEDYVDLGTDTLVSMVRPGGLIADIKGIWRGREFPDTVRRWQL